MAYRNIHLPRIAPSEITSEAVFLDRRSFLKTSIATSVAAGTVSFSLPSQAIVEGTPLDVRRNISYQRGSDVQEITEEKKVTTYNNFYELGTQKTDPAQNKHLLKTEPWTIELSGEVNKPQTIDVDDVMKQMTLEERIYRFRCVEAWSMVVPWIGFQLSELLKIAEPTSKAKYVKFTSIYDPEQLPVQKTGILDWPYTEGLRMDEAMNPLAFMSVGMYGKTLPNQNGAPIRLLLPWKYGYKSAKSIVKIEFTVDKPVSSWTQAAAHEYGFFSNVNPEVSHPRWSQARERRLGDWGKRDTELFNGYGEYVADMYAGMDLKRFH